MATTGDETAPIITTGGKLRKRFIRRNIPTTPYDRPPTSLKNNNNNASVLKKLVDPPSRLIYAGAYRLFHVFRKTLPPGVNEEPQNVHQKEKRSGSFADIAAATEISELEHMLQEKTFTRSEIQHLTSLLHSRTTKSPSNNSLKNPGDVKNNFHADISTPIVTSRAYMGSRPPTNQALIQDSKLFQRTLITPFTQKTANSLQGRENGFVTPRSRGRSAMYTMARTPYTRSPTFSQKSLKHRSSALDDVIGSGGPLRRIRQRANVSAHKDKKELGYTFSRQEGSSQNLVLPNETEPKVLGYASVPAKSTQTANKILQHLEQPSPKEKSKHDSVSAHAGMREKSPNKLTLDMLHGQALRSLEKLDSPKFLPSPRDIKKPEAQHLSRLHGSTSQSKDKIEENGSRKFPVPSNMLTLVNGDSTNSSKDNAPVVGLADFPLKVSEEPPQKKRSFQMSESEDSVEVNDDIHDNGHVSFPFLNDNKPETSVADIIKTTQPEVFKISTLVEDNNHVLPLAAKASEQTVFKASESATTSLNTDVIFSDGSVHGQGLRFNIPNSPPSTTVTHSSVLPQPTLQVKKIVPDNDSSSFSFVKTTENMAPVLFPSKPPEINPDASSDPKTLYAISVNGNGNVNKSDQKSTDIIWRSTSSFPDVPTSGNFLFETNTKNLSAPNTNPALNPTPASTSTLATATTTTAAATFSTSVPPPLFKSASSTAPTTSMIETANTSNRSSFAVTSFATTTTTTESGLSGFSFPAATFTTAAQSQGSFFNDTNGSQTNTHASSRSTLFDSSVLSFSSSPSFGTGSLTQSTETKSGNSTSFPPTNISGSSWQLAQNSSGFSSFISSSSSSVFTFAASSTPMPSYVTGGATNSSFAGPSFRNSTPATTLPNNNIDQMNMEDSMAEDSMQNQSPVSPFCQAYVNAPAFMFSSATPAPTPTPTPSTVVVPFQFGVKSNETPPPANPFQSSSLEFQASGGSFSLGSGGEKTNRRVVRVVKSKNRKR